MTRNEKCTNLLMDLYYYKNFEISSVRKKFKIFGTDYFSADLVKLLIEDGFIIEKTPKIEFTLKGWWRIFLHLENNHD